MAGCESTRLMPSRFAAFLPSTTTWSPRWSWPESKNRPVCSTERTASKSPPEAAMTCSL
jgi:hypothetical protein